MKLRPFHALSQYAARSLRVKVALGVVAPLVLILGTFTALEYGRHRESFLSSLSVLAVYLGQLIEDNVRHELSEAHVTEVQHVLDSYTESKDFQVVYLLDTEGRVVAAPANGTAVGTQLSYQEPDCQPCHRLTPGERPKSAIVTNAAGQRVFRLMRPLENSPECAECHTRDEELVGVVLADISMAGVEAPLAAELREKILWWVGTILVTILIVSLTLNRYVTRRLQRVAQALGRFGHGELDMRLAVRSPDEIGSLARAFNEMGRRIQANESENRSLSEDLRRQAARQNELLKHAITAQEDERKRIARELHDELGQALGGLSLRMEAIERLLDTDAPRARDLLAQTSTLVYRTTERMYNMILDLRPATLDDLGLASALRDHAERTLTAVGVTFELKAEHFSQRLSPEMETALYRTMQEALNNIVRHARARHVSISLTRSEHAFEAVIQDDGQGFDTQLMGADAQSPRGLGLLGMRERITQMDGELDIRSAPGAGTQIVIRIPLAERLNA